MNAKDPFSRSIYALHLESKFAFIESKMNFQIFIYANFSMSINGMARNSALYNVRVSALHLSAVLYIWRQVVYFPSFEFY